MVEVFAVALVLASAMGIAIMVFAQPWQRGGEHGLPMTALAGIAAFAALLSTLGYVIAGNTPRSSMPLVIADTTMPLAIGLLWAAMRRARGATRSVLPALIVPSALVGVTTLWVSPDAGQYAKLGVLFLFSGLTAWECFRPGIPRALGRTVVGVATGIYGVYCLVRLVGTAVLGVESPVYERGAGDGAERHRRRRGHGRVRVRRHPDRPRRRPRPWTRSAFSACGRSARPRRSASHWPRPARSC